MTDKPETNGQMMSRLIRDAPPRSSRQQMLDAIRRTWANPAPKTEKETDRD